LADRLGDKWHIDEAFVTIAGKKNWLWRAVDQDGFILDVWCKGRKTFDARG
jgi:putative transposase